MVHVRTRLIISIFSVFIINCGKTESPKLFTQLSSSSTIKSDTPTGGAGQTIPPVSCNDGNLPYGNWSFPAGQINPHNGTTKDRCTFDLTRKFSWEVGREYSYCFDFSDCEKDMKKKVHSASIIAMVDANMHLAADLRVQIFAPNGYVHGSFDNPASGIGSDSYRNEGFPQVKGPNKWVIRFKIFPMDGYQVGQKISNNSLLDLGVTRFADELTLGSNPQPIGTACEGLFRNNYLLRFGPSICAGQ